MCSPNIYAIIFIIAVVLLFVILAWKTDLLRDVITDVQAFKTADPQFQATALNEIPKPFSLAKTQIAVWTIIISCCYLYLVFSCNCSFKPINQTALLLMGISVGTVLTANAIDASQADKPRHQNQPSKGFFRDILSDENGISIYRFQNVVWTVVAVMVYISKIHGYQCSGTDDLPELDNTLIALTGISGVAYLGVKMTENKPAK